MTAMKHNVADIIWKRPGRDIELVSFSMQSSISNLYLIHAQIKTGSPDLSSLDMLYAEAEIVLKCGDQLAEDRVFTGIVTRFSQGRTRHGNLANASKKKYSYVVEIRPQMWMATRQIRSKVFQEKTCKDIVEEVLGEHDVTCQWQLSVQPRMRAYCVQYEETDYNFVSRLLEDEGICFYFDHEARTTIFANHAGGHPPCKPRNEVRYVEEISTRYAVGKQEFISDFDYEETVTTGNFADHHYNYETSQTNLMVNDQESRVPAFPHVEHYEHTADYVDAGAGQTLVKIRKETAVSSAITGRGITSCRSFDAGFCFTMQDHFREALNTTWLLTSCQIDAVQGNTRCHFTALPTEIPFHPVRKTMRPRVTGLQTATVTGPEGAKVYLDDMGRCKLQFHWDREGGKNDRSSMWVRVSNNYAGKDYGIQWIPRVGHEVLVTFIDGNPDLPIVTGRVYNDFNSAPLKPVNKWQNIIKTIKDNHILFDDEDDAELVQIRAEKDMNTIVMNNSTEYVKMNKTVEVDEEDYSEKTGRHKIVEVGVNSSEKVGKTKSQEIGKDHHLTVKSAQEITVTKNIDIQSESGHVTGKAPKKIQFTSGPSSVTIEPAGITLKLGGNTVEITPAGVTVKGTVIKLN